MNAPHRTYLPAAGRDWLLPLYDPFTKILGADSIRREFLAQAALRPGERVLDIGCGTGTLAILVKRLHPDVEMVGLDPDPKALARAARKAARAGLSIHFDQGFSDQLSYPDASFDRVFSTMMFHHLKRAEKEPTLREVHRVLKPGGTLRLLDFAGGEAHGGLLARILHPSHHAAASTDDDRIMTLMHQAGFSHFQKISQRKMWFLPIATYLASA